MAELIATGLPSTPYPARHLGRLAAGQEQATA